MTAGPLARFKVLDLTRVRAGPTAVRYLADWGADCIKVEMPPSAGEMDMGGPRHGPDFQNLHRNKRSVTLNLKEPDGKAIFMKLVEQADVVDGARAIGMRHDQALRRIILPQAVKRMIPAFMERAIELMKTTTLIATISYADLLFAANEISQKTFRPLETYTVVALIYFVVIFLASQVARLIELRLARSGESTVH